MKRKLKAFTLVELLVAMAIIGIILGLTLFAISQAQRGARDTERRAAVEDINAASAAIYNDYNSIVDTLVFTANSVDVCAGGATGDCITVSLDGGAKSVATASTTVTAGWITASTDTTAAGGTNYYFNNTPVDGYTLGVHLENGEVQDASTASTKITTAP